MSSLAQLQQDFSAALAAPRGADLVPAGLRDAISADQAQRTARRFALYRNNVRLARMNAVTGAYPVIAAIVGEEFMTGLAREYALTHDSASGDLNEYGEHFGDFLAGFAPAAELPYLPDVARLEWQAHRAYYAADAVPFDVARLGQVPEAQWGTLRFQMQAAVSAAAYAWPVACIWQVNQPGYTGDMQVDLTPGAAYALIYRPRYDVAVAAISAGEHAFINALIADLAFADALAQACAAEAAFDPGPALQAIVQRGLIRDFTLED
jgi:hypothetical protein